MHSLDYQIVIQWSRTNRRFEAYSPTLMNHANRFAPDFPKVAYGSSVTEAVDNYSVQSRKLFKLLRSLAILPPPSDVGPADMSHGVGDEELGKMVL